MSAVLCPNPACRAELKETAKPHCMEKRTTVCGWVRCTSCQTVLNARGKWFLNPVREA